MAFERWIGVVAGLVAGLAILWYLYAPRIQQATDDLDEAGAEAEAPVVLTPGRAATGEPRYPLPTLDSEPPAAAPPAASDFSASDAKVHADAARVFGAGPVEAFLVPERVIQNLVATLDSLDRAPVPLRFRAVTSVPAQPIVDKDGDTLTLSPHNAGRYQPLMAALEAAEPRHVVALYVRYYPLLENAYRELGYPGGHLNDRVVAILDHLLATPQVAGPIELVRPKVLYEYADPELERLSSGQKTLIRMGPENAERVKARLREVRRILTSAGKPGPAPPTR